MEKYISSIKDLVIQTLTNGSEIKAKAETGDALSCFQMGMMYLLGIDTPIDFKKASKYFENSSLADDSDANRLLGFIAECERNYSLAFKNYANAGKTNRPYINKVSEERVNLQGSFKKLGLPSRVQNKEITKVLNDYIKGGDIKVDASIKLAMICDDEESCLDAAQALFDTGDYYSSMKWLLNGNIPESNALYVSVKNKISDTKSTQNLPNILEVIEIEGDSFLANFDATPSYAEIKCVCDDVAAECKKEWHNIITSEIATIKKNVEDEEAARIKRQQEEEAARKKKQKDEEAARLKKQQEEEAARKKKQKEEETARLNKQQEEERKALRAAQKKEEQEKSLKKQRIGRIIDRIIAILLFPILLGCIFADMTTVNKIVGFLMFVVVPFLVLRWIIRKVVFIFVK